MLIAEVLSWAQPGLIFQMTDPEDFDTLVILAGTMPTRQQYEQWRREYFRYHGKSAILQQYGETQATLTALLRNDQAELDRIKAKRDALEADTQTR